MNKDGWFYRRMVVGEIRFSAKVSAIAKQFTRF
jgi:hypothetical protein